MAELSVSRKNISDLLSKMQNKKFVIPDYQRPYKWDEEKCETLWNDITSFLAEKKDGDEYFLGTIVTCKSSDSNDRIEIIDGQQRITSLFLLLRAFYYKLELMHNEDEDIRGLKAQIEPCLWTVNEISKRVKDKTQIHIESKVATEKDNDTLHSLLNNGVYNQDKTDLYTANYAFFLDKCNEFATTNPLHWKSLIVTILNKCIVLPIECDNLDTALTIFSTLNDRGMPLSDSDIFKAKIYKTKNDTETKQRFTESWKRLTEIVEESEMSLDDIFRYYTHIIRAKSNDKSREIGLRKFYAANQYEKLNAENLLSDLIELAEFWSIINTGKTELNNVTILNIESQKYLHCLKHYPNEYWKYVVSVFYYKNKTSSTIADDFPLCLKTLTAFLFTKFIENPNVNAIKDDIFQGCIDVFNGSGLKYKFSNFSGIETKISIISSSRISRALILLIAYQNQNQKSLIPSNFEIEHIFPKVWQNTNYNGWEKVDAEKYLERFGNKVAIEKKLNIQAGNGYFGKKKAKYLQSTIADVNALANHQSNDWIKDDIEKRERDNIGIIMSFFRANL